MTIHRPLTKRVGSLVSRLRTLTLTLTLSNYSALMLPTALYHAFYHTLPLVT
jgi:hypothetical protein